MSAAEVTGHAVAPSDALPLGGARAFAVGDAMVAVFRLRSGELRAVAAVCPHSGGPLADGQFDGRSVICPLHNYSFSLADGACRNGDIAVRTYPVREEAGQIVVDAHTRSRV
jgi:nitrite reductase (NADH) small subunit